ncbi:MAG: arginine deiminase-related protein, partial [Pseudoalteromonas nigrifaciens]|uniref:arginine deiminase-related protein n=1 Tax=Pseudoalteromonas nigrifaciens TaxID=28109 RepID=UPI003C7780A6
MVNQAPNSLVMVRPHHFISNPQTMRDNTFQRSCLTTDQSLHAYNEVTNAVEVLKQEGILVHLFEDQHKG